METRPCSLIHPEPDQRLRSLAITWQLTSFSALGTVVTFPPKKTGNNLKGSWYKERPCFDVGWDMQIRMRIAGSGLSERWVLFEKWDKIFLWSATPCDIPTHTLLLTFYLPLNSPAVVTFSGFLIYVLQDLKSDGRNFRKITNVDRHLYTSRSWYTSVLLKVGECSLLSFSNICPDDSRMEAKNCPKSFNSSFQSKLY